MRSLSGSWEAARASVSVYAAKTAFGSVNASPGGKGMGLTEASLQEYQRPVAGSLVKAIKWLIGCRIRAVSEYDF